MSSNPERPAGGTETDGRTADPNFRLAQEYGPRYIEIQRRILTELPTETARRGWAERYGEIFHDLAAADASFHELIMAADPDLGEIRRRVEASRREHDGPDSD